MDILLRKKGKRISLEARGATRVGPGVLDVDPPCSSPVCIPHGLRHFLFVEDRTVVHEAGGSQGSARESGCPIHK